MPKTGDLIAAKYRIEQLIGVGGMGAVFSATHQYTGKRVALKWMLPELANDEDAVQRFMREARAAGRINHPNVVDVYDVGQHDDSYFLVMEHLQG
ncbi:MAG TPA: protein kinase, partial [Polyangiales bacterium]|nr:protein kinase [Polyangiales bacterium]